MMDCKRVQPDHPNGYAEELSGDWNNVPEWAIKRINFLERILEHTEKQRCPLMHEKCPNENMSCQSIKHCHPFICDGACGKCNEIWVTENERKMIIAHRIEVL